MQGMIDLVNKGYFPKGSKVLYAHLGGAPAINGYAYTLLTSPRKSGAREKSAPPRQLEFITF